MKKTLSLAHFVPGNPVVLEKGEPGKDTRLKATSKLVGVMESPSLIFLEAPQTADGPFFTPNDTYCVVRFLYEGDAIGFRARVERLLNHPVPLVVLGYPREYEGIAVRKADRIVCNLPMQLMGCAIPEAPLKPQAHLQGGCTSKPFLPSAIPYVGRIVNLSEGGCQIALPQFSQDLPAGSDGDLLRSMLPEHRTKYFPDLLAKFLAVQKFLCIRYKLPSNLDQSWDDTVRSMRVVADETHHEDEPLPVIDENKVPPKRFSEEPSRNGQIEVCGELRWNRVEGRSHMIGVKFHHLLPESIAHIGKVIQYQKSFFGNRGEDTL
ncbi:TPA: hypothetical protein DDW35_11920 [Candidatus Sumerlaeota bacterium]|jgi:hypothetical protein|nr:hypothetical protein [Candidatus Sumerlaeota bacterium]